MTPIGNCPWPGCGGAAEADGSPAGCWVVCAKCGACGPTMPSEDLAIAAWNRLAGPDVVIGRLRWVEDRWVSRLLLGNIEAGRAWRSDHSAWWECSIAYSLHLVKDFDTARAALVEAVRKAMGGGE